MPSDRRHPAPPPPSPVARLRRPLPRWLWVLAATALAAALAWLGLPAPWAALVATAGVLLLAAAPRPSPPGQAAAASLRHLPPTDAILRDPQTGMFHRAAFLALAERDWQRAGRYGGAVGLLLVEVDRLRAMTDRAGPAVADTLLTGLGQQVAASLRAADLLARFDDAQLAVFLPQADATGALDVAERIRDRVEHLELPGMAPGTPMSASIGVAVLRPLHQPLAALVGDAQRALQTARLAGGNCVRLAPADALPPVGTPGSWVGGDSAPPARDD